MCWPGSRVKCKQQLSAGVKELSPLPPLPLRFNELGQARSVVLGRRRGRWVCIKSVDRAFLTRLVSPCPTYCKDSRRRVIFVFSKKPARCAALFEKDFPFIPINCGFGGAPV